MTRYLLLPAIITLLLPGMALAADNPAQTRLKSAVDQVVAIVKASHDRETLIREVKPPIEKILDFSVMTRRSVGPSWKQFTPDQQSEATRLFTTLILRTYTAKFTPGEYPSVVYKSVSETAPGRVEIATTSLYRGSRYEVIYRMENQSGDWKITDIVIEGVSLVADYRTQLEAESQQGGPAAVVSSLQKAVSQSK
jgi:phospholipid transport system substrate-binding protein